MNAFVQYQAAQSRRGLTSPSIMSTAAASSTSISEDMDVEGAEADASNWRDTGGSQFSSRNTSSTSLATGAVGGAVTISSPALVTSGSGGGRVEPEAQFQVLTTGYWPATNPTDGIILPPELLILQERFTSFYTSKYQGRRLQWAHSLQRCVVTARFPKGKKELEVSLFQVLNSPI